MVAGSLCRRHRRFVVPAAADRLRSRASPPPKAGTMLEALRELAAAKSPGRAKPSARVSPPRWGGRTIGRYTVSFFSLLAATLLHPEACFIPESGKILDLWFLDLRPACPRA